jgi:hypothetical protein
MTLPVTRLLANRPANRPPCGIPATNPPMIPLLRLRIFS